GWVRTRTRTRTASWTATARRPFSVQMLRHGVRRLLQLVDGLFDGVGVVLLGRLLDFLDRGLNWRFVALGNLVRVFLEQLLHLPDHLIGSVPGVDQLVLALVLLGMRLGLVLHALHFGLAETARAFDTNLLLLARSQVLGRNVQNAVGVDVE